MALASHRLVQQQLAAWCVRPGRRLLLLLLLLPRHRAPRCVGRLLLALLRRHRLLLLPGVVNLVLPLRRVLSLLVTPGRTLLLHVRLVGIGLLLWLVAWVRARARVLLLLRLVIRGVVVLLVVLVVVLGLRRGWGLVRQREDLGLRARRAPPRRWHYARLRLARRRQSNV